ncbi:MAG: RluA family pseudouridine synthase [Balneola sp.]|nr:MAG: RluA family pseudouridine synthase [Balneola sp.]
MPLNLSENGTTTLETILSKELFRTKNQLSRKVRLVEPYPITHEFGVDTEFVGTSLLHLMTTKFPFYPAKEWKQRISSGRVWVQEQKNDPDHILLETDMIYHHNPKVIEPSIPDEIEILEETEDYLIVFKPAPMPMHPGGRYFKNSLSEILKKMGYEDLRITHRLDAVTSGIVLFAKSKGFAKKVMQCFSEGKVAKGYLAQVSGTPKEKTITIDTPIRRKQGFVFETGYDLEGSKEAVTHFEVISKDEDSAVIKCIPETGRTHQIRLHLAEWGYPIIDDPIYGKDGDESSTTTQNLGISLVSTGLRIEELDVIYELKIQN